MPYAHIIARAWKIAAESPKIKWFIWFPSFMAALIFTGKIGWQIYAYAGEFGLVNAEFDLGTMTSLITFLTENQLWGWTMVLSALVMLFYFLIPAWIDSVLILALKQKLEQPEKYLSIRQKIIGSGNYFFKMFELHGALALFSPLSVLFFASFIYRSFEGGLESLLLPIVITYFVICLIINIFTCFAEYYLICDDESVSQSIRKSIALVFMNLQQTVAIMLLLGLINLRVLINIIVVLGVPIAIIAAVTIFSNATIIALAVILGFVIIALAAYITALIEIFARSVWIQTFENAKSRLQQLED